MPLTPLSFGTQLDKPMIGATPFVWSGYNIRVRAGQIETLGLFGPLKDFAGNQVTVGGSDIHRRVFTSPSVTTGQIISASMTNVTLIEFDPLSTIASGTRWETFDITPTSLVPVPPPGDGITQPSAARVELPPVWWFADQEDLIVGSRANVVDEPPYVWDRSQIDPFAPIAPVRHPNDPFWPEPIDSGNPVSPAPTPIPTGAVGGGILSRILVLIGCTSFTDPDPLKWMTIRWSDRFVFGQWTPSDLTLSGELQLEGGSRIVGGGVVGFGVIAWTDKRMALLRETFDLQVFNRTYVDGGRGLIANQAWCEADGQVWWMDETRTLNVYDGGRPRQIINTNRAASIERLSEAQTARVYIEPNHEFGEIIIFYPSDDGTEVDAQLVYNYLHDCWYPWLLSRSGWSQRYGVIPNIAVDIDGNVWRHDLDVGLDPAWGEGPVINPLHASAPYNDITPYDFSFSSNMVTQPDTGYSSWSTTKMTVDYLPLTPLDIPTPDKFSVTMTGYREPNIKQVTYSLTEDYNDGETMKDFRVGGKAVRFKVDGEQIRTVFRFGMVDVAGFVEGER